MPALRTWDIFCRVIDNYGDIGVCWRLARQLVAGRGAAVRVWLDDLASLAMLVPSADVDAPVQSLDGIEVHRWTERFPEVVPAEVCIEAFGCGVPERYVVAMAARRPPSLWIVLEYLSAEAWVRGHHGLPSPHPRWDVPRYFFFPGFEPGTGGLLHERDVLARRDAHDADARRAYWALAGFEPPPAASEVISMFAYPSAPVAPLLERWWSEEQPRVVAIPVGELAGTAARLFDAGAARAGLSARRGPVELRVLPFVPQPRFDEGLWSADFVFVRGEDSFVRAQWAIRPFVWHIYEQAAGAHRLKLDAFLARYCEGLPPEAARALTDMWYAWNQVGDERVTVGAAWARFHAQRDVLRAHARTWADRLSGLGDLAENLAEFCLGKLKY